MSSDNEQFTLYKNIITDNKKNIHPDDKGVSYTKYYISFIFRGCSINTAQELKFSTISSEIYNLDKWVHVSGLLPSSENDYFKKEVNLSYKLPTDIEFSLDNNYHGRIKFSMKFPEKVFYSKNISITQFVKVEIKSKQEKDFQELIDRVISFQNFLILALLEPTYPISIILRQSDQDEAKCKDVKLYYFSRRYSFIEKPKEILQPLFKYHDIQDKFPEIIRKWFEKYSLLRPSMSLLFEKFYSTSFNENSFLNLAQAAETLHARLHNHTRISKDDYSDMKKVIIAATPEKYHPWLQDQFNFGNNLNLHTRLTELVDIYSNDVLDEYIGDKEKFVLDVKRSRNYYTHYSKSLEKDALQGHELFNIAEKLKLLLVCAFLMETGFTKHELDKALQEVKWKFIHAKR